jgi:outer membrane receptor protein involved in Fe transport
MVHYQLMGNLGGGWDLWNAVEYVSKQHQGDNETGLDLPPYATWSARVSKKILASELFFKVDNLLDRRFARTFDSQPVFPYETSRNPQPGRTFSVGISISFSD